MDNRIQQLNEFFTLYAARFTEALNNVTDLEETAKSFSDCFISANPMGVMCGNNDEDFKGALRQGYTFYRDIGIKAIVKSSELPEVMERQRPRHLQVTFAR